MKRLRNLLVRNEDGAAIVELAIVAPVITLLMIGVVDMSMAYGRKLNLEQAAHRSIEKVMQTSGTSTVEDEIKAEASAQASVPTSNVTVNYLLECDQVRQSDPTASCTAGQLESRYVQVVVADRYTPMFPVRFAGLNADGTYHIRATAGMRTQ